MVEASPITAEMNVDELLTRWPSATRVFLRRHMVCPGCPLARFETVAEVCAIYQQPVQAILLELRQVATADWPTDTGAANRR